MRRTIACTVLIAALGQARADSADDLRAAREHYEAANAQYGLGNYAKAADQYEAAFTIKHDPALLYNAAQSQRLAGNKPRAILLYQNLLRVYGGKLDNVAEVKRHIAELEKAIAADENSRSSPPVAPRPPAAGETTTKPPETSAPPEPAAKPPSEATRAPALAAAAAPEQRPAHRRRTAGIVAGVVIGAAVVVGVGVALGLTLGRPETQDPTASLGRVQAY